MTRFEAYERKVRLEYYTWAVRKILDMTMDEDPERALLLIREFCKDTIGRAFND